LIIEKEFINLCTNYKSGEYNAFGQTRPKSEARQVSIWSSISHSRTNPLRREASLAVYS
jgi:hypothetical protein